MLLDYYLGLYGCMFNFLTLTLSKFFPSPLGTNFYYIAIDKTLLGTHNIVDSSKLIIVSNLYIEEYAINEMIDSTLSADLQHRIYIGTEIDNMKSFSFTSTAFFL